MKIKDRLFFRVVIVTPILIIGLLFLKFYFKTDALFIKDVSSVSGYLTVIGTLYSILAAFVIYAVWDQFSKCSDAVDSEANDLRDLIRYAGYFNDSLFEKKIKQAKDNYTESVLDDEWLSLRQGRVSSETEKKFHAIYSVIKSVKFDDQKDPIAWQQLIKKYNDVSDARNTRITMSLQRIPVVLKSLLYLVSVAVITGFFLLGIENNFIAVLITAFTTIVVIFVIEVVEDLDDPYTGRWAITKKDFRSKV